MTKQFLEFSQGAQDDEYYLEVLAYDISKEEFKAVREELDGHGFRYQHIEADSIKAKLTGSYDSVIEVVRDLEGRGWTWE